MCFKTVCMPKHKSLSTPSLSNFIAIAHSIRERRLDKFATDKDSLAIITLN